LVNHCQENLLERKFDKIYGFIVKTEKEITGVPAA